MLRDSGFTELGNDGWRVFLYQALLTTKFFTLNNLWLTSHHVNGYVYVVCIWIKVKKGSFPHLEIRQGIYLLAWCG